MKRGGTALRSTPGRQQFCDPLRLLQREKEFRCNAARGLSCPVSRARQHMSITKEK